MSAAPLLKVRDLGVTFRTGDRVTVASTEVSFDLAAGEVLAVVGESGSGKSVSALALTRLLPPAPTCEVVGTIELAGRALTGLTEAALSKVRGKEMTGRQTPTWVRFPDVGWKVIGAHVSMIGEPLVL